MHSRPTLSIPCLVAAAAAAAATAAFSRSGPPSRHCGPLLQLWRRQWRRGPGLPTAGAAPLPLVMHTRCVRVCSAACMPPELRLSLCCRATHAQPVSPLFPAHVPQTLVPLIVLLWDSTLQTDDIVGSRALIRAFRSCLSEWADALGEGALP